MGFGKFGKGLQLLKRMIKLPRLGIFAAWQEGVKNL